MLKAPNSFSHSILLLAKILCSQNRQFLPRIGSRMVFMGVKLAKITSLQDGKRKSIELRILDSLYVCFANWSATTISVMILCMSER